MNAYVLHGPKDLRLEESRPVAGVESDEVLVRVRRTGICGSDVHYFLQGKIGDFVPRAPFAPGHEFAGEVAELGAAVTDFEVGDRVAVDPSLPCGTCVDCRRGRYNLCLNMRFLGSASCYPHIDGGFGEYVAVRAVNCWKIDDRLSYGLAALVEPLSVSVHAVNRASVTDGVAGRTVLVSGAGTIGHLVLLVARAYGASIVAVTDIEEFPRKAALDAGADYAFDPREHSLERFAADHPIDVVIEVSGAPVALDAAIRLVRRGGTIVQVGTQPPRTDLPQNLVMSREIAVLGSFRSAFSVGPALDLAASGRVDLEPVVSAVYPFARLKDAMNAAVEKKGVIKVQVEQGA